MSPLQIARKAHAEAHREPWPYNKPRFAVIDLNGQPCFRSMSRQTSQWECERMAKVVDYIAQDKADSEFCARYGVPFQPRRYFAVNLMEHLDIA